MWKKNTKNKPSRAILEFNLDDEYNDLRRYVAGPKMASFLWDFDQHLRAKSKYNENGDEAEVYYKVRDEFHEMLRDEGLDLDDLTF